MISEWEKHTLLADTALQLDDPVRSILHYQQALSLSEDISECVEIEADERLLISVISCHNLAQFWRWLVIPNTNSNIFSWHLKKCSHLFPNAQTRIARALLTPSAAAQKHLSIL